MPIVSVSNVDINTLDYDTFTARTLNFPVSAKSLKAFTQYDLYVDEVNYNWAAKQFGKDLGDPLVSDQEGRLYFTVLLEFPYEGTYAYDEVQYDSNQGKLGSQTNRNVNYVQSYMDVELRVGSEVVSKMKVSKPIIVTPGHTNRSDHHGH